MHDYPLVSMTRTLRREGPTGDTSRAGEAGFIGHKYKPATAGKRARDAGDAIAEVFRRVDPGVEDDVRARPRH